ncbi:hypothetical protein CJA_1500 [Cellvibrio japonicus Ueda107]|uniref:Uncharacterized protein n=1 Tax=Cellvibrio japonicus (strain Ueda107) TaxID=498211 RepID=B3PDP0_CELJU|nr:hypothetical protein CJA_1500 [Cellvibrio japonicus Ueda107]
MAGLNGILSVLFGWDLPVLTEMVRVGGSAMQRGAQFWCDG